MIVGKEVEVKNVCLKVIARCQLPRGIEMGRIIYAEIIAVGNNCQQCYVGQHVIAKIDADNDGESLMLSENEVCQVPSQVTIESAILAAINSFVLRLIHDAKQEFGSHLLVIGNSVIASMLAYLAQQCGFNVTILTSKMAYYNVLQKSNVCFYLLENQHPLFDTVVICDEDAGYLLDIEQIGTHCRQKAIWLVNAKHDPIISPNLRQEKQFKFHFVRLTNERLDKNVQPIGYVRWNWQREFQAMLALMDKQLIAIDVLQQIYPVDHIEYLIESSALGGRTQPEKIRPVRNVDQINMAFIGISEWFNRNLLNIVRENEHCKVVAAVIKTSSDQTIPLLHAEIYSDVRKIIKNKQINSVIISSNSSCHINDIEGILQSGKHCLLEPCISFPPQAIKTILKSADKSNVALMPAVYYPFSPLIKTIQHKLCNRCEPVQMKVQLHIPLSNHYYNNLLDEIHNILYASNLILQEEVLTVDCHVKKNNQAFFGVIHFGFSQGSLLSIHFLSSRQNEIEWEIFCQEQIFQIKNWQSLHIHSADVTQQKRCANKQTGHVQMLQAFFNQCRNDNQVDILRLNVGILTILDKVRLSLRPAEVYTQNQHSVSGSNIGLLQ